MGRGSVHWQEPEEWWPLIRENWPAYNKAVTPTNTLGAVADDRRRRGRIGVDGHSHHVAVNRLRGGGQAHFHLGQIHQARHAHRHHHSRDQQHRCCHQPDNLLRIYAALAAGRPLIHHFDL